jgi:hypothetical protein
MGERHKWLIRNVDKRVAQHPTAIHTRHVRKVLHTLRASAHLAASSDTCNGVHLTAKDVQNDDTLRHLHSHNVVSVLLQKLRFSYFYHQKERGIASAMVRQLGKPTWFYTMSANDMHWPDLLNGMSEYADDRTLTSDQISALTSAERVRLCRKGCVVSARHFEHRMRATLELFEKTRMLGKRLSGYIQNTEFQKRGSAHVHGMAWVPNAPSFEVDGPEVVCAFIDKHVTCTKEGLDVELIKGQEHHHKSSCQRNGRCRHGFPWAPMLQTQRLLPIRADDGGTTHPNIRKVPLTRYRALHNLACHIKQAMNNIDTNMSVPFDEWMMSIGAPTMDDYIAAWCTTVNRPTIFLRRAVNEVRMTPYNMPMLQLHRGNCNVAFVDNAHACIRYMTKYIYKSDTEHAKVIRRLLNDVDDGKHVHHKDMINKIGQVLLRAQNISLQESVYHTCGLPRTAKSHGHTYVNTRPKEQRPRMLKSNQQLDKLPDNSTNIFNRSIHERYEERGLNAAANYPFGPLRDICLADFATRYTV